MRYNKLDQESGWPSTGLSGQVTQKARKKAAGGKWNSEDADGVPVDLTGKGSPVLLVDEKTVRHIAALFPFSDRRSILNFVAQGGIIRVTCTFS